MPQLFLKSDNSFWLLRTIWYNWDPGLYELTSTMERIIGVKAVSNWWDKKRISPCLMEWTTFSKPETNDSEGFSTSFISGFSRMFDGFSMDFQWFSMDFHGFSAAGRIRHPAGPASGASPPTSAFPAREAKRPWPWGIAARWGRDFHNGVRSWVLLGFNSKKWLMMVDDG